MTALVRSGIIGFSFDKYPSSSIADSRAEKKAREYEKNGARCVSHLINRCPIDYNIHGKRVVIDNLKFHYLLDKVPVAVYGMLNMFRSDLTNIVVVGSKETRIIFEMVRESLADKLEGKNIIFAEEGDELSFQNTLQKGKEALKEYRDDKERLTLFQAGDTPLLHDVEPIISDECAKDYDFILNLNSREMIFSNERNEFSEAYEFFRRNYYSKLRGNNFYSSFKEANAYLLNLDKIDGDLLKFFTGKRKAGALGIASLIWLAVTRKPSKIPGIVNLAFWEGHLKYNVLWRGLRKAINIGSLKYLFNQKFVNRTNITFLEGIGRVITDGRVRVKANHKDFSRLADIDSLEDWRFYEELIQYAKNEHGGLDYIYPHADDIRNFKARYGEELRKSIPMYYDFQSFINERFSRFGLFAPYHDGSLEFVSKKDDLEAAVEHMHKKLVFSPETQS